MAWFLLLCVFAVDCYAFEQANQQETTNIMRFLETNEIKQLVIAQSEQLRPPPNRRWYLKCENINLKDVQKNTNLELVDQSTSYPRQLQLRVGDEWHVLYPSTCILLQQAVDFVKTVHFISEKNIQAVEAAKLNELLNQKTCKKLLPLIENAYGGNTAKNSELVRQKIAEWKEQYVKKQAQESIKQSEIEKPRYVKFIGKLGHFCFVSFLVIGVLYWAHLCKMAEEMLAS